MNTAPGIHNITPVRPGTEMDHALNLLAEAFDFEVVDRCPTACRFCDESFTNAA